MKLIEKWYKESEDQEKYFLKQNLYSCFASIDPENKEYPILQEAFELLRNGKSLDFKGSPYFQVLPLVFINHHRFYNAEIIDFLKENVAECSADKKALECCFCFFTVLFFTYSGSSIESSLEMLNDIFKDCVEEKIFDNADFCNILMTSDLDTVKNIENVLEYILAAAICSIKTSMDRAAIINNFQKNTDAILILADAIKGLLAVPDKIDFDSIDAKHRFIKKFYKFCIKDNSFSIMDFIKDLINKLKKKGLRKR